MIASGDNGLGRTDILRHSIDTGNASLIRQQVRRTSLPAKEKVRELLKNMMQKKVISPSKNPWGSPQASRTEIATPQMQVFAGTSYIPGTCCISKGCIS